MEHAVRTVMRSAKARTIALVAVALAAAGTINTATQSTSPDHANAKKLVKAMSDYLASQNAISFDFETNLEVVSRQNQKLGLASSGTLTLNRPGKISATRHGGFANVEFASDGKMMTLLGKDAKVYAQVPAPATIDQLVDELRDKYHKPVPAADLLMSNVYDQLMPQVVDAKDLGSGVIGGVECDHLAFRTAEVDWEIWIAQGIRPYPCRYVITSTQVAGGPQYTIDIREWKTGAAVAADRFSPQLPADAKKLNPGDLRDFDDLPGIFAIKRTAAGGLLPAVMSGLVTPLEAIVGRPLTPVSVAGVARRTARRCAVGVYYC